MEHKLPTPSTFSNDEEEWMETLGQLLAVNAKRTFWLSLQSKPLSLSARPYQLRFDKRKIYLCELQQSPNPNQPPLGILGLPEPGIGSYRQYTTEDGETWLGASFRLLRDGDSIHNSEMFANLSIATCEELLGVPPSDIPHQSVQ